MNANEWNNMTADQKIAYANGLSLRGEAQPVCIELDCGQPAGTPWTRLWCWKHDDERRARISKELDALAQLRKEFGQ